MCPVPLSLPASPDELGDIPTPEACCTSEVDADAVIGSCEIDCAYAACKLASNVFAEQAAEQLADGGIGTANAAADISNATLELSCDIAASTASGTTCGETPNFEEAVAGDPGGGPIVGGSLTISGPAGDAGGDVMGVEFELRVKPCSGDVCGIVLTRLDLMTTDLFLGPLKFDNLEVSLVKPSTGTHDGEDIMFGALVVLVTTDLSIFTHPIGTIPLIITNHGPVLARLTSDDMFEVVEANFRIGAQTGTLTIEPSPVTFGG